MRLAKQNHPARRPFTNYSNCMTRLGALLFYESSLLTNSCFASLWGTTYEKLHWAIDVLNGVFWSFVMNSEDQELIWLKFYKFPNFINIIISRECGIIGGKLVGPAIPCTVCFWLASKERLPTPVLNERQIFYNLITAAKIRVCFPTQLGLNKKTLLLR